MYAEKLIRKLIQLRAQKTLRGNQSIRFNTIMNIFQNHETIDRIPRSITGTAGRATTAARPNLEVGPQQICDRLAGARVFV